MKKLILLLLLALPCFAQQGLAPTVITGNLTASSSSCLASNCTTVALLGQQSAVTVQLTGTWSATAQFEISSDNGTTWNAWSGQLQNATSFASSATANGVWQFNTAGYTNFRVRLSAFSSGTVAVTITVDADIPSLANFFANTPGTSDPCQNPGVLKSNVAINISSATTTALVAVSGATAVYVCGFSLTISQVATTANTIAFEQGTGAACAGTPTALTGLYGAGGVTAAAPIVISQSGPGTIFKTAASNGLCALTAIGASGSFQGVLTFVQQ